MTGGRIDLNQAAKIRSASADQVDSEQSSSVQISRIYSSTESLKSQNSELRNPNLPEQVTVNEAKNILSRLRALHRENEQTPSARVFEANRAEFSRIRKEEVLGRDFSTDPQAQAHRNEISHTISAMTRLSLFRAKTQSFDKGSAPVLNPLSINQLENITKDQVQALADNEFVDLLRMVSEYFDPEKSFSDMLLLHSISVDFMLWRMEKSSHVILEKADKVLAELEKNIYLTGNLNGSAHLGIIPKLSSTEIKAFSEQQILELVQYLTDVAAYQKPDISKAPIDQHGEVILTESQIQAFEISAHTETIAQSYLSDYAKEKYSQDPPTAFKMLNEKVKERRKMAQLQELTSDQICELSETEFIYLMQQSHDFFMQAKEAYHQTEIQEIVTAFIYWRESEDLPVPDPAKEILEQIEAIFEQQTNITELESLTDEQIATFSDTEITELIQTSYEFSLSVNSIEALERIHQASRNILLVRTALPEQTPTLYDGWKMLRRIEQKIKIVKEEKISAEEVKLLSAIGFITLMKQNYDLANAVNDIQSLEKIKAIAEQFMDWRIQSGSVPVEAQEQFEDTKKRIDMRTEQAMVLSGLLVNRPHLEILPSFSPQDIQALTDNEMATLTEYLFSMAGYEHAKNDPTKAKNLYQLGMDYIAAKYPEQSSISKELSEMIKEIEDLLLGD